MASSRSKFIFRRRTEVVNRPTYIFFHICTIKNWTSIVTEQLEALKISGLLDKTTNMFVGYNGPDSKSLLEQYFLNEPKVTLLDSDVSLQNECSTINLMTQFAKTLDIESNLLYIHTKGVTEKNDIQHAWRRYMMKFVVTLHHTCTELLEEFYTVGSILIEKPKAHYSGNFFWTRSSYMKKLPLIVDIKNRYNAENHILSAKQKACHASFSKSWYCLKVGPFGINNDIFKNNDTSVYIF